MFLLKRKVFLMFFIKSEDYILIFLFFYIIIMHMGKEMSQLLSIGEAAQFLDVSEMTLRRWTNSGKLRCIRVGGERIRKFHIRDLNEFKKNNIFENEDLINIEEAAKILNKSEVTIRRWIKAGKIKTDISGYRRKLLVNKNDLINLKNERG